ncbi:MarR family transcriptional regulator [uncultured Tateyamaria sp.]|uniref:MarR family winged helix-turn-helix transcriptional regulator n=1 Tax=uncultured Tateyamaria sp. TaxID=455651 RepID=UPI0026101EA2|nr:MarR family transcriptional regulator [uncultured Tateyamaria sp.]
MTSNQTQLRDLLHRIARLVVSEGWEEDLNPTQRAALRYLARANRFSRAPSHVADYLSATRGTVSQTLKALSRKGLIKEFPSETDRRSISYEPTPEGLMRASADDSMTVVLSDLPDEDASDFVDHLSGFISAMLAQRGNRTFGMCSSCLHHEKRDHDGYCKLLGVELAPEERQQLCHEHREVDAA